MDALATRTIVDGPRFAARPPAAPADWTAVGRWPCAWIGCHEAGEAPVVVAYRRRFRLARAATVRVHVTADERYDLFLDGRRIGRGSERGSPDAWFYETYDLALAAGEHVLVGRVWSLGPLAPTAQLSVRPGFLLAADDPFLAALGTGVAAWEAKRLGGYAFVDPTPAWGTGANLVVDGARYPWGFERGEGEGWRPATRLEPAIERAVGYELPPRHVLRPATLPPMREEARPGGLVRLVADPGGADPATLPVRAVDHLAGEEAAWTDLVAGRGTVTMPPGEARRVLVDLETYVCAYPEVVVSGGAGGSVSLRWAETLCHQPAAWCQEKGHRDEVEGKFFVGVGDAFRPDGGAGRRFAPLWWQAGRFLELTVRAAAEPLTVERVVLRETGYPLAMESAFAASDPRLERLAPLLVRGMRMCAHETYVDCPYYEQLQYAADARLQALVSFVMTRDDRLPRKALLLFDRSRRAGGMIQARFPSRVPQVIAPFALWWIGAVRDYALWRDDPATVAAVMPGVRATLDGFDRWLDADGLLRAPDGWNFLDWTPAWEPGGVPPDAAAGTNGAFNWALVLTLVQVADLEERLGEPELAARARRRADALAARATEAFWDEGRGLVADDRARRSYSEHGQCLALLSGRLEPARRERVAAGLMGDPGLTRTTISFAHHLFETYRALGRIDALIDRLGLWFDLERIGLSTPLEMAEPSRSDCHAWGAHPLYHYFASILGIRPAGLGFREVEIAPRLGPLASAEGRLVHPRGEIVVAVQAEGERVRGTVRLPPGVTGALRLGDGARPIGPGEQAF